MQTLHWFETLHDYMNWKFFTWEGLREIDPSEIDPCFPNGSGSFIRQSTTLSNLDAWRNPLYAIVAYTCDLSQVVPDEDLQDCNFYFLLNKVRVSCGLCVDVGN